MKIVGAAEYGVLTWCMDVSSNSTFFMRPSRSMLQWRFVTDLDPVASCAYKAFLG